MVRRKVIFKKKNLSLLDTPKKGVKVGKTTLGDPKNVLFAKKIGCFGEILRVQFQPPDLEIFRITPRRDLGGPISPTFYYFDLKFQPFTPLYIPY
jgi:hypothetical protein